MSLEYSAQDGVVEGLKKTFDGEHPCAMCHAVAQARQEEGKSAPATAPNAGKDFKVAKDFSMMETIELPKVAPRMIRLAALQPEILADAQLRPSPPLQPPRLA